ncbi:MAG: hypothetical protein ACK4IA_16215 [Paracoccus hibiscisoli]
MSFSRVAEGHSKLDAMRALKRCITCEGYGIIMPRHEDIDMTRIAA